MIEPAIPENDDQRSLEIERLGLIYSPAEDRFDRITRLAKTHFGVPIVLISMVYKDVQWFKSAQGLHTCETSRSVSFCGHAILQDGPLIVENPLEDDRFKDNPLVLGQPKVRFYAGIPLRSPSGFMLGTLCLIDHKSRRFDESNIEELRDFAALVEAEFFYRLLSDEQNTLIKENEDLKRKAMLDGLSGMWNKRAIEELLTREVSLSYREQRPLSVLVLDIDHFKQINDTYGHPAGDETLKQVAQRMKAMLRVSDVVGRLGGDEFLVLLPNANEADGKLVADRLLKRISDSPVTSGEYRIQVTLSIGVTTCTVKGGVMSAQQILERADRSLYEAKNRGRNCSVANFELL
ncbi:MAG: sensor domain-containing diguanylate cyclase [Burkholderiales bacterium]|jgi:diguanylate cyclase (GGDEF)-like protein|nr:sensor domain-containing diguanylate cyclase [Burkholderiales bacterium]